MKIYIEHKINGFEDLPKKERKWYIVWLKRHDNINYVMADDFDWWMKQVGWYLEPIELSDGADAILAKWEGHEGMSLNDDRARTNRMRVIAVMKEFAAQEVAKDRAEHLLLEVKTQPTDEEIIKQAKENYQYKDSGDYGEDVIHAKRTAYFDGAKAALSGEIKKKCQE